MKIVKYITASLATAVLLASCSVNRQVIKPNALIKLPQKTVVNDTKYNVTANKPKSIFEKQQVKLEMSVIRQTPTPIWIPPVIAKVLILPYVDKNNILHSYQYAFVKLAKGKWLIGSYLNNTNGYQNRIFTPLDASAQTNNAVSTTVKNKPKVVHRPQTSNASFFQGGKPKPIVNTSNPTQSSGTSNNQEYFNNTINAMK